MYKKILLATDFSDASGSALSFATDFAGRDAAELHVLHVEEIPTHGLEGVGFPGEEGFDSTDRDVTLKALADLKVPGEMNVVRNSERGVSVASTILNYVAKNKVDLIVVGSHGRTGLTRLFLGSVAQEVLRRSQVPVLVVGIGGGRGLPEHPKILVPLDFSDSSKVALHTAAALAAARDGILLAMHVIDLSPLPPYFSEKLKAAHREEAGNSMSAMVADAGLPSSTKQILCEGVADIRIVETASDHDADLIVMGAVGHGILDRLLLGSVTERVLRSAPCAVLVRR